MAQGPTYRVKFRRRREGKTNYYRRRRLLQSRQPRLVVRKTNKNMIVQFVDARVVGDSTEASAISTELAKHGWTAGTGNLPAAYLTGLLAGLRAKQRGIQEAVLDIGLNTPVSGSRVYAALKGVLDAGVEVPHKEDVLPDESRISGEHIVAGFEHFNGEKDSSMFTALGTKKTNVTGIPKQVDKVKKALLDLPAADLKKKAAKRKPKAVTKATKKPKKEKPAEKPPRAKPRKPKPKKLVSRGRGKKGKKSKT